MSLHTADQKRAQAAFARVNAVASKSEAFKKKYSTQCRRLPQLIQRCGLCQTVAFLQSKKTEEAIGHALDDFARVTAENDADTFARQCRESHLSEYQRLTRHALQCAAWMKRYAEALLPREE